MRGAHANMKMTTYRREGGGARGGGRLSEEITWCSAEAEGGGCKYRQQSIKIELKKIDSRLSANEWGS